MHPRRKGYSSLHELYNERDAVPWYWRTTALAASSLILAGYLILPSTFDSDPGLRFSKGVLAAIVAVFLTGGYALTVALVFLIPSWLFQYDLVFYPSLCSSGFGLLGVIYAFASSSRYKFDTGAGITIALATVSTVVFTVLYVWMHRRIARTRQGFGTYRAGGGITIVEDMPRDGRASQASTARLYQEPPSDGRVSQAASTTTPSLYQESPQPQESSLTPGLYQEPNYYRNYIANMHPTAIRAPSINEDTAYPGAGSSSSLREQPSYHTLHDFDRSPSPPRNPSSNSYYDLPPTTSHSNNDAASPFQPQIGEDEQVSQHLARLLLNTRDGIGNNADPTGNRNQQQSTFRIDWPTGDEDDGAGDSPRGRNGGRGIQLRTRTGSGSRLVPPGKLAEAAGVELGVGTISPPLARLAPFRGGGGGAGNDNSAAAAERWPTAEEEKRGRGGADAAASNGHRRAKSREDRRKEIELGFVGVHPAFRRDGNDGGGRGYRG